MTQIYIDVPTRRILRLHHYLYNGMAVFTDLADGTMTRYSIDVLDPAELPPAIEPGGLCILPPGWAVEYNNGIAGLIRQPYRLFNGPGSIRFVLVECLRLAACAALVGLFSLLLIGMLP